ncbi:MAG: tRNA dihydrouridine synthase [Candidatus Woesearchaeota archaeon]
MGLSGKLMLAPMAGITDAAFRSICVDHGAEITVSELVSVESILRDNEKVELLLKRHPGETCFGIQLFGSDPVRMALAAKLVEPRCDFIDINMGCPAPKVYRSGAGSALLDNPALAGEIVRQIRTMVSVPVSVKIRLGINDSSLALPLARVCEVNGASWITVHGRTRKQGYAGIADWDAVEKLKSELSIPVVGNGDLSSPEDVSFALNERGVDAVAIGRAASGNPWIFETAKDFLLTGSYSQPSIGKRLSVFATYLRRARECNIPFINQKQQAQHFIKGLSGASRLRAEITRCKAPEDLLYLLRTFEQKLS